MIRKALLFLSGALVFSLCVNAAVSVDNSASYGEFNLIPPVPHMIVWPHTIGTGSSRTLIVTVSRHNSSTNLLNGFQTQTASFTDAMSNTTPMTSFSMFFPTNTSDMRSSIQLFYLVNPTSGPGTVNVTLDPLSEYAFGSSVSFNGVDQVTPFSSYYTNSNSGPSTTLLLAEPVTGDMVIDGIAAPFSSGAFIVGPGQTDCFPGSVPETSCRRGRRFFGSISDVGASSVELASSPVDMTWTLSGYVGGDWIMGAVTVRSLATTAASGTISGRVLSHNGMGIPRVVLSLTGGGGQPVTARTNSFGYFRFDAVELGNTYILQPTGKNYVFAPQILSIDNSISDLNLFPAGK